MTKKQAYKLRQGDLITVIFGGPHADNRAWVDSGTIIRLEAIIPKVRIVKVYKWQDGHDEMIFGKTAKGERVWLNFVNAAGCIT